MLSIRSIKNSFPNDLQKYRGQQGDLAIKSHK